RFGSHELAADPRVVALRERVRARSAGAPPAGDPGLRHALAALPPRGNPTPVRRRRAWPLAMAASVLLLAVTLGVRFMSVPDPVLIYATGDALREVLLEDGTRVQLDVEIGRAHV